jgi:glycosyltransferase involved in cell wall biosynthesis
VVFVPDYDLPAYFLRKPKDAKFIWFCRHNYLRFRDHPLLEDNWWSDIDVAASMERRALRKADVVVSPSSYMAGEFRRTYGREDLPVRVIPNFIAEEALASIEPHPLRAEIGVSADVPIVCIPSAGTVPKGKRHAFEIVRRIGKQFGGKIVFFLTGAIPGDLAYELQHVGEPVLVYAPGHLPWRDNIARIMACDVVVSPTLVENFSNALVEAHSLGKTVVTFDTGGNREIVRDGETGYVVPYLDIDRLVECTLSLLHDHAQRSLFGERARSLTRRALSPDHALEQYRQLFAELAG